MNLPGGQPKPDMKYQASLDYRKFGRTNIYKTIKVIKEDGSGAEIDFGYRIKQFKCKNGCEHHNHLVCVVCGQYSYLDNTLLEDLQDQLAKKSNFIPKKHTFQIFGLCKSCQ